MEKILFKMAKNSPILRLTFTFKVLFCSFIEYFKHTSACLQSVAKLKQKKASAHPLLRLHTIDLPAAKQKRKGDQTNP